MRREMSFGESKMRMKNTIHFNASLFTMRHVQAALAGTVFSVFCLAATVAPAATNYYVVPSSPTPTDALSWTNWADAHTNLIEVLTRVRNGDTIYLTNNATYRLTNYAGVNYAITLRSWAPDGSMDRNTTILNGNYPANINPVVLLNKYGATIAGFTITNGCDSTNSTWHRGGGVHLISGVVTNCIITGNRSFRSDGDRAYQGGGGICAVGKGTGGVWNCIIAGNLSSNAGGGIFCHNGSGPWQIMNCTIADNCCTNTDSPTYSVGGGLRAFDAIMVVSNCLIASNSAVICGGIYNTTWGAQKGLIQDCRIIGNTAYSSYAGGMYLDRGGVARNCLIANNTAKQNGAGIYLARGTNVLVENCTVVSNHALNTAGGVFAVEGSNQVENTIFWGNLGDAGYNEWRVLSGAPTFTNCCTSPHSDTYMTGTVVYDPLFTGFAGGDYHLTKTSPCINAGIYREWMDDSTDLDGRPRLDHFTRRVDIGCFEYLPQGTLFGFK